MTTIGHPRILTDEEMEKRRKEQPADIFIICTVRGATYEYKKELEEYVKTLEDMGYKVHLPHRDTNQNATGYEICSQNYEAIKNSKSVHIFYNAESQGTHFDMGVTFALNKNIVMVERLPKTEGKSFVNMLYEWEKKKSEERFNKLVEEYDKKYERNWDGI